jgi:hypothetical protein
VFPQPICNFFVAGKIVSVQIIAIGCLKPVLLELWRKAQKTGRSVVLARKIYLWQYMPRPPHGIWVVNLTYCGRNAKIEP